MRLNVELAHQEHLDKVALIEAEIYGIGAWSKNSFVDILNQPNFIFYVASINEEIVGYFVCQIVREEAELHNISVAPKWQRQGIGKQLLQILLEKLKPSEVSHVFLMVRASNEAAKKIYAHFGFTKITVRKNYYNDPVEDAWILKVLLNKRD